MIRRSTIIALSLLVALPAVAHLRDSLSSVQRAAAADDALSGISRAAYDASIAASAYRRQVNISTLAGVFDLRREEQAMVQEEGDGLTLGKLRADSYMHLKKRSTVEAEASYRRGVKRNVCWNSSSDYTLLYPHIGADSIGGNLTTEQYGFGGSYAHRGERVTYGIGASYRALHEFRKVDPRPRNITSDVKAQVACGYNFKRYMLGASAAARIYNQQHSVDYYNIKGSNTSQIPMTGLGTYYERFAGASSGFLNYEFKGFGYSASVQFVPLDGNGLRLMADYTALNIRRLLPDFNNTMMTRLRTECFSGSISYATTSGRVRWAVGGDFFYEIRRGDENVLNISSLSSDMVLATFTMYEGHTIDATLTGGVEWLHDWGYLFVRPRVGILNMSAGYRYPERRLDAMIVEGGADIGARYQAKKWLVDISAGGGYAAALSNTLFLSTSAEKEIKSAVQRQWQGFVANRLLINAAVSVQRAINYRTSIYLAGVWQMYSRQMGDGHTLSAEIGIKF